VGLEGGSGIQYIGREKLAMPMHSLMLLGPGIPHYAELIKYPSRAVTIYFLPILLFDSGPQDDGARVLNRFTSDQPITERIVTPPPALWSLLKRNSLQMLREFREGDFGSQFRLRSLLLEMLVGLMRWEKIGQKGGKFHDSMNWEYIQKGLNYIQEHFSEPLYIEEIARFVGISDSRLKTIFRESLGMSCVQYIKTYRISLAAAEMCASRRSITDIAFSVGYETLSNFNTAFHKLMGMSPTKYISSMKNNSVVVHQESGTLGEREKF
jgi:AraC-like DNA-binding protein